MGGFFKREEVVGKLVITPRAEVIGKVTDIAIGLDGRVGLNVRTKSGEEIIVTLDEVDAIEDVILLKLKKEGEVDVAKTKGKICPNCGKLNRETAKFCTNCGYPLEPESVESTAGVQDGLVGILCEIELSGISTDLKTFTTNKDSIKLGRKSLKDALAIFDRLPKAYPKGYEKKVKKQKALPLSLTIDRDEGTLFITLQFDGTYYVEVGVRALGEAIAVAPEARTDEVRELIHRFYSDPSFFKEVEEMIAEAKREQEKEREKMRVLAETSYYEEGDRYHLCVTREGVVDTRSTLDYEHIIWGMRAFYPFKDIEHIVLKKGFLGADMEIRYFDNKGKVRKIKYSIEKGDYEDIKNVLLQLVPKKVMVK